MFQQQLSCVWASKTYACVHYNFVFCYFTTEEKANQNNHIPAIRGDLHDDSASRREVKRVVPRACRDTGKTKIDSHGGMHVHA